MKKHIIENYTLAGIIGTTILSGILLSLPYVSAGDGTVSNVAIRVNSACSMTASPEGSNDTPHTADLNPGTYLANIGKTTIKTVCNDANGFSIYAVGYTNDEYGNTVLKPSTVDASNSIITGTATSAGIPDTSNWAMKISPVTGTYAPTIQSDTNGPFSDYHAVPSTFTKVASNSSVTDATIGSSIEVTYSAYIAGTQPADLYNGKVKFTMVHPATEQPLQPQTTQSGKICYYPNGSNVDGTMGCQDIGNLVELLAPNYSRPGYGFAGWSNKFDWATNNADDLRFYGPNETISIPKPSIYTGEGKGLSLYAVWIKSQGSLQDTAKVATLCSAESGSLIQASTSGATLASVSALTDERDNQTYAIAKLADGNCWMIENLRLESTASHNTDGSLAQGYNSSFIGLATAESPWEDKCTTANSLYSTDGSTTATISGSHQDFRFPRYNNTNTSTRATNPATVDVNIYSYGNYYTWHAAIADTSDYSSGDHSATSICPTGWRLPIGDQSTADKSFGKLSVSLGGPEGGTNTEREMSTVFRSFPNNYVYSGFVKSDSISQRGSIGLYSSSTLKDSYNNYFMYLSQNSFYPGTARQSTYAGLSIRCVVASD